MAYCQFGPLTAYPRAQRTRDLYPSLPVAPLPAVITCIATVASGPRRGSWPAPGRGGLRGPRRPRVRRRRGVPGARAAAGRDERRDPGVLGGGRVRPRRRRPALPGHAPRVGVTRSAGPAPRPRPRRRRARASLAAAAARAWPVDAGRSPRPRAPTRDRRRRAARSPATGDRLQRDPRGRGPPRRTCRRRSAGIALVQRPGHGRRSIAADPDLAATASAIAVAFAIAPGGFDGRRSRRGQRRPAPTRRLRRRRSSGPGATRTTRPPASRPAASPGMPKPRSAAATTYIGTCAAGARTYHVYLEGPNVDRLGHVGRATGGFGEQIVAGLRRVGFGHARDLTRRPTARGPSAPRAGPS